MRPNNDRSTWIATLLVMAMALGLVSLSTTLVTAGGGGGPLPPVYQDLAVTAVAQSDPVILPTPQPTPVSYSLGVTRTLVGEATGSFHEYGPIGQPLLSEGKTYELRLSASNVNPMRTEEELGVEIYSAHSEPTFGDPPYGLKVEIGPNQYKLVSQRHRYGDDRLELNLERIVFQVPPGDVFPSFTFKVFNYAAGMPLEYQLNVLPLGENE